MTREVQRARRPEDKEERRRQILDSARALLDADTPFAALTMADVARAAGLAKGTPYLYYPTKEALFLAILLEDLGEWFGVLRAGLLEVSPTPDAVAERIAATLSARPRLVRLLGLLHAVLEENLDLDTARAFKRSLAVALGGAGEGLEQRLSLAPGTFPRLLLRLHALVVGLGAMSRPSPVVATVLAEPGMEGLRVEFEPELRAALADWLRGMSQRSS